MGQLYADTIGVQEPPITVQDSAHQVLRLVSKIEPGSQLTRIH